MDLYIDLSILLGVLHGLTCFIAVKTLTLETFHKGLSLLFIFFHGFIFFLLYLPTFLSYIVYIAFTLFFGVFLFQKHWGRNLLIYYFFYFALALFISSLSSGIVFKNAAILITSKEGLLVSLWIPIFGIFLCISSLFVDKMFHLRNYIAEVVISIGDKTKKMKAYFDTGNTLRYKNAPVVFLGKMGDFFPMEEFQESIYFQTINGMGKIMAAKGLIHIEGKKDSFFVYVAYDKGKEEFHGCDLLLNAYIF